MNALLWSKEVYSPNNDGIKVIHTWRMIGEREELEMVLAVLRRTPELRSWLWVADEYLEVSFSRYQE